MNIQKPSEKYDVKIFILIRFLIRNADVLHPVLLLKVSRHSKSSRNIFLFSLESSRPESFSFYSYYPRKDISISRYFHEYLLIFLYTMVYCFFFTPFLNQ